MMSETESESIYEAMTRQVNQLTKENSELRNEVEIKSDSLKRCCNRLNEIQSERNELRAKLDRAESNQAEFAYKSLHEIADLTERAERAEADCAVLRLFVENECRDDALMPPTNQSNTSSKLVLRASEKAKRLREQLVQCKAAFNRHGWDTCQLDSVLAETEDK